MNKSFRVFARAVNPCGRTIGITQDVKTVSIRQAISTVIRESTEYGLSRVIISAVRELKEVR